MENVLFKISFPAEFHAQTAVEAALTNFQKLKDLGKTYEDIKKVTIRTQEAATRIIDEKGLLYNYADRDHCIQYMVAIPLIHDRLTADDYSDAIASKPVIDELRDKMEVLEDEKFSIDYLDAKKRYIGDAIQIKLNYEIELDEVVVEFPIGLRKRREEGKPVLLKKYERHLNEHFNDSSRVKRILEKTYEDLKSLNVDKFVDLFVDS